MTDVPHLALPLRLVPGGSLAVVEQDGIDDVTSCVAVLLATPVGSRIEIPDFGVPDLTFTTDLDVSVLAAAITEWEPRAAVDFDALPLRDDLAARILAAVSLA